MVQSHFSIFPKMAMGQSLRLLNHIYTYIQIYLYLQYIYTYIYTYIHKYIYTYIHIYIYTYIHIYIYTYIHTYIYIYMCVCCFFLFGISMSWTIYLLGYSILTHTHIRGVPKIGLPPIFQVMDDHDLVLNQWWLGDPPRLKVTPDILWLLELVLWLLYDYYMMIMLNPNFPISSPRSSYNNHNIS